MADMLGMILRYSTLEELREISRLVLQEQMRRQTIVHNLSGVEPAQACICEDPSFDPTCPVHEPYVRGRK